MERIDEDRELSPVDVDTRELAIGSSTTAARRIEHLDCSRLLSDNLGSSEVVDVDPADCQSQFPGFIEGKLARFEGVPGQQPPICVRVEFHLIRHEAVALEMYHFLSCDIQRLFGPQEPRLPIG